MNLSGDLSLITTLVIIFSTGVVSGLSPCTLPTVAFIVAYVSGKKDYSRKNGFILSLCFILGIAFMLSLLGMFAGVLGNLLIQSNILNYIIATILILMGLWMLKILNFQFRDINFTKQPKQGSGALGAFLLGIPFGISSSPCTIPITASVLAYSASKGSSIYGMMLMFTYAMGRSLPLLVVGTFTGLLNNLKKFNRFQDTIEKISGVVLIFIALYFLWIA
jgi:cytochrome c-type biogenesis protein